MDTNAERVIARLYAVEDPLPQARPRLSELGARLVPDGRAGDFAQGLMDLGSLICTPKRPLCGACPLSAQCRARALGMAEELPRKPPERARPLKRGAAFVARDGQGAVYLVRRPEEGLLGGMLQPPLGNWVSAFPEQSAALAEAPFVGEWVKRPGIVRHGFTHFVLELEVYAAEFSRRPNGEGIWLKDSELDRAALPTVMRKVLEHGLADDGPLLTPPVLPRLRGGPARLSARGRGEPLARDLSASGHGPTEPASLPNSPRHALATSRCGACKKLNIAPTSFRRLRRTAAHPKCSFARGHHARRVSARRSAAPTSGDALRRAPDSP